MLTQGYPSTQNVIKTRPEEISNLLVFLSDDLKLMVGMAKEIDSTKLLAESCIKQSLQTSATIPSIVVDNQSFIYIEPGVISLVDSTETNIW